MCIYNYVRQSIDNTLVVLYSCLVHAFEISLNKMCDTLKAEFKLQKIGFTCSKPEALHTCQVCKMNENVKQTFPTISFSFFHLFCYNTTLKLWLTCLLCGN